MPTDFRQTSQDLVVTRRPSGAWKDCALAVASRLRSKAYWVLLATLTLAFAACLGDPVGPTVLFILRSSSADTLLLGTPGSPLPRPIILRVVDADGYGVPAVNVRWTLAGQQARLDSLTQLTDRDGYVHAVWILGTRATETQSLKAEFRLRNWTGSFTLHALAIPSVVRTLRFMAESCSVKLGVRTHLDVKVADPFGNVFVPVDLKFRTLDSSVAVDSIGFILATRRGVARVLAEAGGLTDTSHVRGIQVVTRIEVPLDTVRFHSIGQTVEMPVKLYDDQGLLVADSFPSIFVHDSLINDSLAGQTLLLQSAAPGTTAITLSAGEAERTVAVRIYQVTARIHV